MDEGLSEDKTCHASSVLRIMMVAVSVDHCFKLLIMLKF